MDHDENERTWKAIVTDDGQMVIGEEVMIVEVAISFGFAYPARKQRGRQCSSSLSQPLNLSLKCLQLYFLEFLLKGHPNVSKSYIKRMFFWYKFHPFVQVWPQQKRQHLMIFLSKANQQGKRLKEFSLKISVNFMSIDLVKFLKSLSTKTVDPRHFIVKIQSKNPVN